MLKRYWSLFLGAIAVGGCTVLTTRPEPTPASGPPPAARTDSVQPFTPPPAISSQPLPAPTIKPVDPSLNMTQPTIQPVQYGEYDWRYEQPQQRRRRPWEKLGELSVSGDYDQDVLRVDEDARRFGRILFRVQNSRVRVYNVTVEFMDGTFYQPELSYILYPGDVRSFDLPGRRRHIRHVIFNYGDLRGGGRAHVEVWAR